MDPLDQIVGQSASMLAIQAQVRRLLSVVATARRIPPVLLLGETGTGKGLLARSLHAASPRATGPFVAVNCAAIPETLLEAELFGFERGAFTDARQAKPGLFQEAHGGTLFLDEAGLLPEGLQAKLLTALDDRVVRRLGATRVEPADCWIIAATSVDLERARRDRRFREDLYHRLSVFTVSLPPLREREEDILRLADVHLARVCADYGLPAGALDASARAALARYPWPGNVRELGNVLERAALLSEGSLITADTLGLPGGDDRRDGSQPGEPARASSADLRGSLDELERSRLVQALEEAHGNVSRAADLLGMPRNTLRYRLERHGLTRPAEPASPRTPRDGSARPAAGGARETARRPARTEARGSTEASNAVESLPRRRTVAFLRVALIGEPSAWMATQGLRLIAEKTETFGGRVVEQSDGAIDAAFGLEPAEDASPRAAYAALAVQRLVAHALQDHPGTPIKVAIETLACEVVETPRGEPRLTPDSLDEARRALAELIDRTEPDRVVVGLGAAPHLERQFSLATLAADGAPGATLLARRERVDDGHDRSPHPRKSPFVGREPELTFLQQRLSQVAATRRGHILSVMGEPGIGKSRLLLEFRETLPAEGTVVLEGRCVSYAAASPYGALADVLHRAWGLDTADDRAAAVERVRASLLALGLDPEALGPYLLALLGIESAPLLVRLSPEAIRARTFAALEEVLQAHARSGTLVLLIEDLHWVDPVSGAFVASLAERLPGLPLLVVVTTRPGHHLSWLERSWASQVALPPLALADSRRIAQAVLPRERDATVVERIARRGEGNPFFLEELACAVADQTSGDVVTVPATVAAALEARIDRLPSEPRRVLEVAAVLGREVPLGLLAAVTSEPADVLVAPLRQLVAGEFLYEKPGAMHIFKHALTQEVAYARVPEGDRQTLHAAAGAALESLHAERLDEHLDQLAHHFDRTTEHAKAVHYLARLARRMEASYALAESIEALDRAVSHCLHLRPPEHATHQAVTITSQMAIPLALMGRAAELEGRLRGFEGLIDTDRDPALAARFHLSQTIGCDFTGRFREAEHVGVKALTAAERADDRRTMGHVLFIMAQSSLWTCDYRAGADRAERARTCLDPDADSRWLGMAAWVIALHRAQLGQLDRALDAARQTHALGVSTGDPRLESYGLSLVGWLTGRKGQAREGLEHSRPARDMAPDANARACIQCFLGQVAIAAGDVPLARKELREGFEFSRAVGFSPMATWILAWLAVAELHAGEAADALGLADEALSMADRFDFALGRGLAQRARGLALVALERPDDAVAALTAALDTFGSLGTAYDAALCRLDLARVLPGRGAQAAALEHLGAARSAFEEMGVALDAVGLLEVARTLGAHGALAGSAEST